MLDDQNMLKDTFLQLPVSAQPHTRTHNYQREGGKEHDASIFLEKVGFFIYYL